ncbi:MAG: hypothetical protein AAGC64_06705 [Bacteroidota bacterium]
MKVTTELLERHGMGLCTEEEKKAIKLWFETLDDPSMNLPVTPEVNEDRIWSKMSQSAPELQGYVGTPNLPLLRRVVRYAAAACIIFAAFFGGRFSANTANANPAPQDPMVDHLFIYGGDNAKGNLPGDAFKIGFNGTIKLYNNGFSKKTIKVGDSSFVLESHKYYYLIGNTENSELMDYTYYSGNGSEKSETLKGYFSLHETDK